MDVIGLQKERTMIPFYDLRKIQKPYENELCTALERVVASGNYLFGNELKSLENEYSQLAGCRHSIGVGSGLAALRLIFQAMIHTGRLKRGDEVIVPSNTFIATFLAVSSTGLIPVPAEPDHVTLNLSAETIMVKAGERTRAVVPVHLYGRMCAMDEIVKLASAQGWWVVEDAAQAHGAEYLAKAAGSYGVAAGFSFYPAKNLGAPGDGGMVCTSDDELADRVRKLRNYGSSTRYVFECKGENSRLSEISAAFLRVRLRYLSEENQKRCSIAEKYLNGIAHPEVVLPAPAIPGAHVWHLFVIRCKKRDQLMNYLYQQGIQTLIHYPIAPHRQGAYPELSQLSLPFTENIHNEVLSLPLHPALNNEEIDHIINTINRF